MDHANLSPPHDRLAMSDATRRGGRVGLRVGVVFAVLCLVPLLRFGDAQMDSIAAGCQQGIVGFGSSGSERYDICYATDSQADSAMVWFLIGGAISAAGFTSYVKARRNLQA